jgi:glycosyltransferase involved in cell wall biosynthesis
MHHSGDWKTDNSRHQSNVSLAFVRGIISDTQTDWMVTLYLKGERFSGEILLIYSCPSPLVAPKKQANVRLVNIKVPRIPVLRTVMFSVMSSILLLRMHVDLAIYESIFIMPGGILFKILNRKSTIVMDIRSVPLVRMGTANTLLEEVMFRLVLRIPFVDAYTVITSDMASYIKKKYGGLRKKRTGIYGSGYSEEFFAYVDGTTTRDLRESLKCENNFVVMYHGNVTRLRGLATAISGVKIVSDKGYRVKFIILGTGPPNDMAWLRQMTKILELENTVTFVDPVPHERVPAYLSICDVGILPLPMIEDWAYQFPLKVVEYMALGKPVLVSGLASTSRIVPKELVLERVDPEVVARKLEELCNDRQLLQELGSRCKDMSSAFTWRKQASKLSEFLRSVTTDR